MFKDISFTNLNRKIFQTVFLCFVFFSSFFVSHVNAAKLDVVSTYGSVNVGDNVKVRIILSSTDQSANAVSSTVSFSNDLLTLNSISKSDSIISLWPVEPSYSNAKGTVNIEGVVLNGYKGSNGIILTLFFKAKASGVATIKLSNASVLANDGQGTQILSSTGETHFDITEGKEKEKVINNIVESVPVINNAKDISSIQIEEIKKKDEKDSHSRFFITSVAKKSTAPYKIELDNTPYVWDDTGDHIFETVPLSRGIHSIKVYVETVSGEIISKSLSFNNTGILTPVFTDYSNDISENEYIVVKGKADPNTYVIISMDTTLSNGEIKHESTTLKSNEKGLFTYVSETKLVKGIYFISASARTEGGIESESTSPIKILVKGDATIIGKIMNVFSTVVPLVALLVLLIVITAFGWYRVLHYKIRIHKRLIESRALINKSFSIIEEDFQEESRIFKKLKSLQPLTEDEKAFVAQFKKDIEAAERTIISDIKDSDKGI